jgi:tRNA threonylcarbamoyladenosine biosynthesis protein TsaB
VKLLALETATPATRVALAVDGEPVAEVEGDGRPHAAALLPAVERLLGETGTAFDDLDAFAVSIGPGSFTGLRIGLATAKAFALGGRPLAGVPTLAALAWPRRRAAPLLVASLDAQRGELYAAAYEAGGELGLRVRWAECVLTPAELEARTPREALRVGAEGEGPRAAAVAEMGARLLAAGAAQEAGALVPRYVRRAEAEARRLHSATESPGERRRLL